MTAGGSQPGVQYWGSQRSTVLPSEAGLLTENEKLTRDIPGFRAQILVSHLCEHLPVPASVFPAHGRVHLTSVGWVVVM